MADLTLTVLDTATIYEAHESIFRYDLPGTGVVEGWALAGVVEQAVKLVGPAWPSVEVMVCADPSASAVGREAVEIITRHIRLEGVRIIEDTPKPSVATSSRPRTTPPAPDAGAAQEPPRSVRGRRRKSDTKKTARSGLRALGIEPLHLGVCAVALVLGGGALWGMLRVDSDAAPKAVPASTPASTPASLSVVSPQPSVPESARMLTPTSSAVSADAGAPVEVAGMRLTLPRGFGWTEDAGLVTLSGRDPHLRVLIAADPLYSVPGQAILDEVRAQVEAEKELSQLTETNGRVAYVEDPGDGSIVAWTTWIDGDHQLSVGCHSKETPTVAHKAACRIATESLEKLP